MRQSFRIGRSDTGVPTSSARWVLVIVLMLGPRIGSGSVLLPAGAADPPLLSDLPPSVALGARESDTRALLFLEQQNLELAAPADVDVSLSGAVGPLTPDTIPTGTRVDSYFLHTDPVGTPGSAVGFRGAIVFDREILGVQVTQPTIAAANATLGAPGTTYEPTVGEIELGAGDGLVLDADRRTLRFDWATRSEVDQVRILTRGTRADDPRGMDAFHGVRNDNLVTASITDIDHPFAATDLFRPFVTQNLNPGGGTSIPNPSPVALSCDPADQWQIWNLGTPTPSPMPIGAAFNVLLLDESLDPAFVVHISTLDNTLSNFTLIELLPEAEGNPDARLLVDQVLDQCEAGGSVGAAGPHEIGVFWHSTLMRWAIFHQDLASMPEGAIFHVHALSDDGSSFVHTADAGNTSGHGTSLDDPRLDDNPDVLLQITQNWNPGGVGGTYNDHPVGVRYDAGIGKWRIENQDLAAMPLGASFNVYVPDARSFSLQQVASAGNTSGSATSAGHPDAFAQPSFLFHTPTLAPAGAPGGVTNDTPTGSAYWTLPDFSPGFFQEDGSGFPLGAATWAFHPTMDFRTTYHEATSSNIVANWTVVPHPLLDGEPDAILFASHYAAFQGVFPNLSAGVEHDHNLGVWYDGNQWAVFNQDLVGMTAGTSFNVHAAHPDSDAYVHTATGANTTGNATQLDHGRLNDQPEARIIVTQNWNPGGMGGIYNDQVIGVDYDAVAGRWEIVNQNGMGMPIGASFNVLPLPEPGASQGLPAALALLALLRRRHSAIHAG